MIYRWLVRKQAAAGWQRLSEQRFDETPLADDTRGAYFGRVAWAKVVEEVILPDTKALVDALEQARQPRAD
ncbi:hypothetical protein A5753_03905 [Mycobacterium sp. 852002-51971_SCH5477799-a]|uniref:hypothetical protein n=1 Tax=Mycobacterium sp. 852002-51971_SCH5477799-a TaxID=1834106 RepID=UPI000801930B|nr:hypothetical protein [Mycobacterium sp. 852002-51971_SCH5477799-a]OBF67690.1 hypothetical protein A5753_03905 [Mycobacterium sp. 852002-51971_SCH5477799-a]